MTLEKAKYQEEFTNKIRELQKEVDRLNSQLKEKRFGLTWIDVPEAFEKDSEKHKKRPRHVGGGRFHNLYRLYVDSKRYGAYNIFASWIFCWGGFNLFNYQNISN